MKQTTVLVFLLAGIASAQDSLNVRSIGYFAASGMVTGVAVSGDYVCLACQADSVGLRVISIADPAHPVEVGHHVPPSTPMDIVVQGDYTFMAEAGAGLRVISIVDPAHPVEVGYCDTPDRAYGVAAAGSYAYVADRDSGLRVISIADPAHPVEVGHCGTPGRARAVAVAGDYAYVAADTAGLRVISVADPANPSEVGHCSTPGQECDVAVVDGYAYVAAYGAGLRVISIADPAHPQEVGYCSLQSSATGVAVDGDHVYASCEFSCMRVVACSDPTEPLEVGHYRNDLRPDQSSAVACSGGYAFVANGPYGLWILQYYGGGVEESPTSLVTSAPLAATVTRGLPAGAAAFDAMGRRVLNPRSGVYLVREELEAAGTKPRMRKVILQP